MNRKVKYIGIVIISTLLFITLHLITPPALTSDTPRDILSALSLSLGLPLTALLWAGIAYSCVAFGFSLIEDRLPGKNATRGLHYGVSIGTLWLMGYVMTVPMYGNPFIPEFVGGLCDAVPVVLMGWLLGLSSTKEGFESAENAFKNNESFVGIAVFVLVYSLIRIVAYHLNIIDTGFQTDPVYTLAWTIIMGLCLGITYSLLGKTARSSSHFVSAIRFGFLLFGLTWGSFILFLPLVLKGQLTNTILMFLIDTLSVSIAYYLSETLINRSPRVQIAG
ncbi:MAG: hypothetical protein ACM3QW_08820 [Ignavibacteriales bacterium]